MNKPKTFFDIYDELKPAEVKVEKPKEEALFKPEEPKVEEKEQTIALPEGFEENLINKISAAVIAKMQSSQDGGNENE